eukprot:UN4292
MTKGAPQEEQNGLPKQKRGGRASDPHMRARAHRLEGVKTIRSGPEGRKWLNCSTLHRKNGPSPNGRRRKPGQCCTALHWWSQAKTAHTTRLAAAVLRQAEGS